MDYLVEDNVMDEFAYRRKWKRPMVEWHTRIRMDDVDYLVENNTRNDFACACSQELEQSHNHHSSTNIYEKNVNTTTYYHDD